MRAVALAGSAAASSREPAGSTIPSIPEASSSVGTGEASPRRTPLRAGLVEGNENTPPRPEPGRPCTRRPRRGRAISLEGGSMLGSARSGIARRASAERAQPHAVDVQREARRGRGRARAARSSRRPSRAPPARPPRRWPSTIGAGLGSGSNTEAHNIKHRVVCPGASRAAPRSGRARAGRSRAPCRPIAVSRSRDVLVAPGALAEAVDDQHRAARARRRPRPTRA